MIDPSPTETVTVSLSRRSVKDMLDNLEDTVRYWEYQHTKNPHYPSVEAMFEEFPNLKEQLDAYRAALSEPAVVK